MGSGDLHVYQFLAAYYNVRHNAQSCLEGINEDADRGNRDTLYTVGVPDLGRRRPEILHVPDTSVLLIGGVRVEGDGEFSTAGNLAKQIRLTPQRE